MGRGEPGAQEGRDLQEPCAAAVLWPGLQVRTPLSTVHGPPLLSRSGSLWPHTLLGTCGQFPILSQLFPHLSRDAMVQTIPQPRAGAIQGRQLLGWGCGQGHQPFLPSARKSGHICVPQCQHQPGSSPGSLCQCQRLGCCCSPAFPWLVCGAGETPGKTHGLTKESESRVWRELGKRSRQPEIKPPLPISSQDKFIVTHRTGLWSGRVATVVVLRPTGTSPELGETPSSRCGQLWLLPTAPRVLSQPDAAHCHLHISDSL